MPRRVPPGKRIIYLKNPSSGSHFRMINDRGGSGSVTRYTYPSYPRRPTNADSELFRILNIDAWRGHPAGGWAERVPRGKGIKYTPGIFIGTGGARYKMAGSNWFVAPERLPGFNFGKMITGLEGAPGFGPYEQVFTPMSRDRQATELQHPFGTPGTLVWGAGQSMVSGWNDEQFAAGVGVSDMNTFGSTPKQGAKRPPSFLNPNRNAEPSAIVRAWQRGQEQHITWDATTEGELYSIFGDVARGAVGFSQWIAPDPNNPAMQAIAFRMMYPLGNDTAEDWMKRK